MEFHFKTYKEAKDKPCNDLGEHYFFIIKDKKIKEQIRKEYPKLKSAIWQCMYCDRVIEAT